MSSKELEVGRSLAGSRSDELADRGTGSFCWVGLATSDPAGAKAFYVSVFDWQSDDLPAGEIGTYTVLRREGKEVATLYRQTREARAAHAAPHWTPYVLVDDADAGALHARELGGGVLREPHDLVDAARVAALRDPGGGILSLWQPRLQTGAELFGEVGALCWHELVTADVERAKAFYRGLLGWEYEAGPSGHTMVINADTAIAAMREHSESESVPAGSWIPYFGVKGVNDAQHKAEQSGGRTLTTPADGPIGRTALLADPQGATFGILEQPLKPRKETHVGKERHTAR